MGHLGLTEVLLAMGLVGLIFAETIFRRLTRWVARTKPTTTLATTDAARDGDQTGADTPEGGEKAPDAPADAGS